ncbi:MAG: hypothetical protein WC408_06115 [Candidatus Micrarchaeia archaeon]
MEINASIHKMARGLGAETEVTFRPKVTSFVKGRYYHEKIDGVEAESDHHFSFQSADNAQEFLKKIAGKHGVAPFEGSPWKITTKSDGKIVKIEGLPVFLDETLRRKLVLPKTVNIGKDLMLTIAGEFSQKIRSALRKKGGLMHPDNPDGIPQVYNRVLGQEFSKQMRAAK